MTRSSEELESCLEYSLVFKKTVEKMAEKQALQSVGDGTTIASQATSRSISGFRVATNTQQATAESR